MGRRTGCRRRRASSQRRRWPRAAERGPPLPFSPPHLLRGTAADALVGESGELLLDLMTEALLQVPELALLAPEGALALAQFRLLAAQFLLLPPELGLAGAVAGAGLVEPDLRLSRSEAGLLPSEGCLLLSEGGLLRGKLGLRQDDGLGAFQLLVCPHQVRLPPSAEPEESLAVRALQFLQRVPAHALAVHVRDVAQTQDVRVGMRVG